MTRWIRHQGITYNRPTLGFPKVEFTRHALDRLKQRSITKEETYRTIENPDEVGLPANRPGRQRVRWQKNERFAVDVVYEVLEDRLRVITVIKIDVHGPKGKAPMVRGGGPESRRKRGDTRRKRPK